MGNNLVKIITDWGREYLLKRPEGGTENLE
jgi:hypothetical protein